MGLIILITFILVTTGYIFVARYYKKKRFKLLYIEGLDHNYMYSRDRERVNLYSIFWPWYLFILWYSRNGVHIHKVFQFVFHGIYKIAVLIWEYNMDWSMTIWSFIDRIIHFIKFKKW